MERMLPRRNERMSAESRLLYGLAGGALVIFGMSRRSWLREPLALVGADLLSYGATDIICMRRWESQVVTRESARERAFRTSWEWQVQRSIHCERPAAKGL